MGSASGECSFVLEMALFVCLDTFKTPIMFWSYFHKYAGRRAFTMKRNRVQGQSSGGLWELTVLGTAFL